MVTKSKKHPWIFSVKRREALRSAQKRHVYIVGLGKRAYAKGMR